VAVRGNIRLWLATLSALGALALLPAPATAGVTSVTDRGTARAKGLSASERKALDIARITARGGSWGVIVRVRFKGNVHAALGRGRLRRAAVAMILRPRNRRQRPAVLAARGPARSMDTLRRTSSRNVTIVRDRRQVDFLILGGGLANVRRIDVKAIADMRRPRSRRAIVRPLTAAELELLLNTAPADGGSLAAPPAPDPDPDVCRLLREDAVTYARQEEERVAERNEAIRRGDRAQVEDLNRIIPQIKGARGRLRPVLGRNRCVKIDATFGYEHFQGFTHICGEFVYDLPVAQFFPGTYRLFRLDEQSGIFVEVPRAFFAGGIRSFTTVAVTFKIDQYGTYKVVFEDRDLPGPVERIITVPPPPPQETRDCG
jgi:hypothetical protein